MVLRSLTLAALLALAGVVQAQSEEAIAASPKAAELASVRQQRSELETRLTELEEEFRSRQLQLLRARRELEGKTDSVTQDKLNNEVRRVNLTELEVKSQRAAIARLQRKEQEILAEIAAAEKRAERERQAQAERERQRAAAAAAAKAAEVEAQRRAQLEQSRQAEEAARAARERAEALERERLAEEERERQLAAEQARQAALEAEQAAVREAEAARAREAAQQAAAQAEAQASALPEETGTGGSTNINEWVEDSAGGIVMRSRNLRRPLNLLPLGDGRYLGEALVDPGNAYFDIGGRRYRGDIRGEARESYIFLYDLRDRAAPKLVINRKDDPAAAPR